MLPKTIICYVLKCLNSGKVKAETLGRLLNSFLMHLHVEFEIMEGVLDHPENPLRNCTAHLLNHFSQKSLCQIFLVSATFWFFPAYVNLRINMFDYYCCHIPRRSSCLLKYRFGVRCDQPHNFWFLIIGLLDELKYAVRTRGNYRDAHYATNN